MRNKIISILLAALSLGLSSCGSDKNESPVVTKKKNAAIVLRDNTAIRIDPFVFSAKIATLSRGTRVAITGISAEKQWIGKTSAYWYKIKHDDGLTGWTYGTNIKKISADDEEQIVEFVTEFWEKESAEYMEKLAGVWWSVNRYGDFTSHCIEFSSDGTYKSYKKNAPDKGIKGEYTFNFNDDEIIFLNNTSFSQNLKFKKQGESFILSSKSSESFIRFKKIHDDATKSETDEQK